MMTQTRTCRRCEVAKPLTEFYSSERKGRRLYGSYCKPCHITYTSMMRRAAPKDGPAHMRPRRRRRVRLADLGLVGITQTILGRGPEFGEPMSNAMPAALATVLGLPLTAVPHFASSSLMRAGGMS